MQPSTRALDSAEPTDAADAHRRFDPAMVAHLAEPVRRYFLHALAPGAPLGRRVRLRMAGRIKLGLWLPFTADWEGDGRSFAWRARVGWGPFTLFRVIDRFQDRSGSMDVRLFGRIRVVHVDDQDTVRSGAGRAAVEAAHWAPARLLPECGVSWRAESDEWIVATWDVPPERPEVRLRIDSDGAVREGSVMRWDSGSHGKRGHIPCGGEVVAEQRFGDLIIPSRLRVGWWYGTPHYEPFFEAEILSLEAGSR